MVEIVESGLDVAVALAELAIAKTKPVESHRCSRSQHHGFAAAAAGCLVKQSFFGSRYHLAATADPVVVPFDSETAVGAGE